MHHHVSVEDDADLRRLLRFLMGEAVGFVASGGGGLGPAHIGVYKAFTERGVSFDILGGTSVGAAVLGGFAILLSPEHIDRAVHDVFVSSRVFKRFTIPRYSLIDHKAFDQALQRQFGSICVEDAWLPYFAVASVLGNSKLGPHLIRSGPLWKAVRASGSLPAVLPPVVSEEGALMVDGGLVENIPLKSMKKMKTGPNLIVHFTAPETRGPPGSYVDIPGRWQLMRHLLTPSGRRKIPVIPGPIDILRRCLLMNQGAELLPIESSDLVLKVPIFPGANLLSFDQHIEVFEAAYLWAMHQIDRFQANDEPAWAQIMAAQK
jgi:NTE family protein